MWPRSRCSAHAKPKNLSLGALVWLKVESSGDCRSLFRPKLQKILSCNLRRWRILVKVRVFIFVFIDINSFPGCHSVMDKTSVPHFRSSEFKYQLRTICTGISSFSVIFLCSCNLLRNSKLKLVTTYSFQVLRISPFIITLSVEAFQVEQ